MIANALFRSTEPGLAHIPIRIFAIDPVPGSAGFLGGHMWSHIELTPNVKACQIVLSQHDLRRTFSPVLPPAFNTADNTSPIVVVMPGNHSSIVEPHGCRHEAPRLVFDMAKRFLMQGTHKRYLRQANDTGGGTTIRNDGLLSSTEILNEYARMASKFERYRKESRSDGMMNKFGIRKKEPRLIRSQDRTGSVHASTPTLERKRPAGAFFVNIDHEAVFQDEYRQLYKELKRNPNQMFSTSDGYNHDLTEMSRKRPHMRYAWDQVKSYVESHGFNLDEFE